MNTPYRGTALTNQAAYDEIQQIMRMLPDEEAQKLILFTLLTDRCRTCLSRDPSGQFWCCPARYISKTSRRNQEAKAMRDQQGIHEAVVTNTRSVPSDLAFAGLCDLAKRCHVGAADQASLDAQAAAYAWLKQNGGGINR
jgi:hypothetical protein